MSSAVTAIKALTDTFDSAVLVDCFTPKCGPCASLSPISDSLGDEFGDQLVIEKVDVAAHPDVAKEYGVRGVPTLLLFKNGELLASRVGAATRTQVVTWLSANGAF